MGGGACGKARLGLGMDDALGVRDGILVNSVINGILGAWLCQEGTREPEGTKGAVPPGGTVPPPGAVPPPGDVSPPGAVP